MSTRTLTQTQRNFFSLASQAVFANPFDPRRVDIDALMAGLAQGSKRPEIEVAMTPRLQRIWASLGSDPKFTDYAGHDRELVMQAMLFDTFWHYSPHLDAVIQAQIKAGDVSVQVPIARELLGRLRAWGFGQEQSRRFFAICYQVRRAYFFIRRDLPGPSACMQALRQRLWVNIFTSDLELYENHLWCRLEDFSTFLLGETGSGKGTCASALGRCGWIPFDEDTGRFAESFTRLFVPINLSQYTQSLIESELFGHEEGAFTGAIRTHQGVFGRCHRHGVIFLDEIGEVSIPVQIKLLNVLQDREFTPVGSHEVQRFEGRVIAATNRSIHAQREQGTFRDDFFYRLCSDIIEMPSLRQRIQEDAQELEILVAHIVGRVLGEPSEALTARIIEVIMASLGVDYAWHGNVRELEQCVRRIILTGDYRPQLARRPAAGEQLARELAAGELSLQALTARYCQLLYARLGTYEAVGEALGVDRRTVRKYVGLGE